MLENINKFLCFLCVLLCHGVARREKTGGYYFGSVFALRATPRQVQLGCSEFIYGQKRQKKVLASCYSPALLNAVPSPCERLTSVFGMETGVATQL